MARINQDFLSFDAESIKDIMVRKLSEDPNFTDQIFEGSNLTTIIDVFAFAYSVLQFYLNQSASEAIFADSQLYENMNRIVKMIGYNPRGFITPITDAIFEVEGGILFGDPSIQKILPKYSFVETGLTDTNGDPIIFSLVNDRFISQTNLTQKTLFFNGRWTLFDTIFDATGIPFEEFILESLDPEDLDNPVTVAHPFVHVYVRRTSPDGTSEFIFFSPVSEGTIFGVDVNVIGPDEKVFELRLNEDKRYVLRFGDGVHGERLLDGDEVFVVFLKSNGIDGKIGANVLNSEIQVENIVDNLNVNLSEFLGIAEADLVNSTDLAALELNVKNTKASSESTDIENVDQIRVNAPDWFRTGGRLVTTRDYENHIRRNFRNNIIDINAMNNWEYLVQFQQFLFEFGRLSIDIRQEFFRLVDSCDFNNIYLWLKFNGPEIDTEIIRRDLLPRKHVTAETVLLKAFDVTLVPAIKVRNEDGTVKYDFDDWDPNIENFIQIIKDENSLVSVEKVKENVLEIIAEFFRETNLRLGQNININGLNNQLIALDGVKDVKTVFLRTGDPCSRAEFFNGLSFALFTRRVLEGDDLTVFNGNFQLRDFQFPVLLDESQLRIKERVKIVSERFGAPDIEF